MHTKRAGELMVPLDHYPHIPYWFTIRQAVAEMETAEIDRDGRRSVPRAVLVFDEAYRLMGFVRRRDILRGLLPNFLQNNMGQHQGKMFDILVDPNLSEVFSDEETDEIRELAGKPISTVMNPIVHTASYDDHLLKVVREMVVNNYYMLPVQKDGKVVGVVRSLDVLHEIAGLIL